MDDRRRNFKREHDGGHENGSKRPRYDHPPRQDHQRPHHNHTNGTSSSKPPQPTILLPTPLPDLPSIAPEYTTPTFTHPSRAPQEFTHPISSNTTATTKPPPPHQSYDRLEFLGDAYIEVISTRLIWSLYRTLPTGRMSSIREKLVKNETLAEYAIAYNFPSRIGIEPSARPQTRTAQIKLHGDIFEAYVAAMILSDPVKGFEIAEDWLGKLWEPLLRDVQGTPEGERWKDELAKRVVPRGVGGKVKLSYVEERPVKMGKGVETYFMGVYLSGLGYDNQRLGSGEGLSKKAAGMEAARRALEDGPLMGELVRRKEAVEREVAERKEREATEMKEKEDVV